MKRLSCHLPLLVLTAILLLSVVACGNDEPRNQHHGNHNDPTPVDTTHHNDTTGTHGSDTTNHHPNDTTPAFSITIDAERDYGFMGETLQLSAATSSPATVTWRSSHTAVASVDGNGLVTFNSIAGDDSTLVIATAAGVSDTLVLFNRYWKVAAKQGNSWSAPTYFSVHRGDTIALTIIDSQANAINDHGFNAAACQWSLTSRNAEGAATVVATPSRENGWQYRIAISNDAPDGALFIVTAQYDEAASAITCSLSH